MRKPGSADEDLTGRLAQYEEPSWEPLERALESDELQHFMWMHEVELDNGTRLQAYKHYWTRRYLHLSDGLRAYVFIGGGLGNLDDADRYRPVSLQRAIEAVMCRPIGEGFWEKHARRDIDNDGS
jgi:hypothetical protein